MIIPDGLGTALKPAVELICLARKPLEGTVAQNVLKHGCGALDIDGSRIAGSVPLSEDRGTGSDSIFGINSRHPCGVGDGRWPSNVIFDPESARLLDEMSGESVSRQGRPGRRGVPGEGWGIGTAVGAEYADSGGASRYFYTAKADQSERPEVDGIQHPTVKPLDLMRYLVGLVSREGDMVLEPFAGSGTTVAACVGLGRNCTRSELNPDYVRLIEKRMQTVTPSLFSKEAV